MQLKAFYHACDLCSGFLFTEKENWLRPPRLRQGSMQNRAVSVPALANPFQYGLLLICHGTYLPYV